MRGSVGCVLYVREVQQKLVPVNKQMKHQKSSLVLLKDPYKAKMTSIVLFKHKEYPKIPFSYSDYGAIQLQCRDNYGMFLLWYLIQAAGVFTYRAFQRGEVYGKRLNGVLI